MRRSVLAIGELRGVVDVDWYVEDDQPKYRFVVDQEKAALNGVSEAEIVRALRMASAGEPEGLLHDEREKEDVPIVLRLDRATRSDLDRLRSLRVVGREGNLVSIGELVLEGDRERVLDGQGTCCRVHFVWANHDRLTRTYVNSRRVIITCVDASALLVLGEEVLIDVVDLVCPLLGHAQTAAEHQLPELLPVDEHDVPVFLAHEVEGLSRE